jgi:hypothetical protein
MTLNEVLALIYFNPDGFTRLQPTNSLVAVINGKLYK